MLKDAYEILIALVQYQILIHWCIHLAPVEEQGWDGVKQFIPNSAPIWMGQSQNRCWSNDWDSQDKHDGPFPWTLDLLSSVFSVATLQTLCINTLTLCLEEPDKWLDTANSFPCFLPFCVMVRTFAQENRNGFILSPQEAFPFQWKKSNHQVID